MEQAIKNADALKRRFLLGILAGLIIATVVMTVALYLATILYV